jgi:DNA polymerase III epsilon subunit-like protein
MTARPLVFLDTETTGLHPARQAWEIAALRREEGKADEYLHLYVDVPIVDAEPAALRIGGYYDRHPDAVKKLGRPAPSGMRSVSPRNAAAAAARITHDATIVGACPWFDTETLEPLLRAHGHVPMWHYRLRDVEAMTAGFTGDVELGGLRRCAEALGIPVDRDREHTAMGDVLTTAAVFDAVILGNEEFARAFEAAALQVNH